MNEATLLNMPPRRATYAANETFALAVGSNASRRSLFLNDRGVTLSGEQIGWTIDDQTFSEPLARIWALHLETQSLQGGVVPVCKLTFADGATLRVMACSATGSPDAEQTDLYREFIGALHRQLSADDRARIDFTSGLSETRYRMMTIGMYLSSLLVILPVVGFLVTHEVKDLLFMIGGIGIFWRTKASVDANAPQRYDPQDIPGSMLG